jgi:sulfoacetaldehyde acetyltransferase
MADGYSRVTGRHGVCIAQNGPGITNFVTGVAAAYWAHSPVVAITPETGSLTIGLGGFQETEQLPIFSKITKYQGHVKPAAHGRDDRALLRHGDGERGPVQLNIPRDFFYGEVECEIPQPIRIERGAGDEASLDAAAEAAGQAKFPVILAGGGVIMAVRGRMRALAEYCSPRRWSTAICTTTPSRRAIRCGAARSATRARRRR